MHKSRAMTSRRSRGEVRPYVRSSKPRFNWSGELKRLFDDAVRALGGPRNATPKQIRELMKCSHVQLSHIKSRLQMCRIRIEEKERRSASNSSLDQPETERKVSAVNNVDSNYNEDERDSNISAPFELKRQLIFQLSPQSDHERHSKRLRVEDPSELSSHMVSIRYYYFVHLKAPQSSRDDFFMEKNYKEESLQELPMEKETSEEEGDESLELSLSLSTPGCRREVINLDLSISMPDQC
ncbi:Putative Myb family transcription factor [Apostasia shenzhenica]|uniref:Myb family transcription factor n=1 Tax=Apostasia shenzhenica TaxID=1088818 RepID=A0A2I0A986_9ASPA|nr:Putative Myb family transcription factor [Apostasia shenzhenica]